MTISIHSMSHTDLLNTIALHTGDERPLSYYYARKVVQGIARARALGVEGTITIATAMSARGAK